MGTIGGPCDIGKRPDIVPVMGAADFEFLRVMSAWRAALRRERGELGPAVPGVVRLCDRRPLESAA